MSGPRVVVVVVVVVCVFVCVCVCWYECVWWWCVCVCVGGGADRADPRADAASPDPRHAGVPAADASPVAVDAHVVSATAAILSELPERHLNAVELANRLRVRLGTRVLQSVRERHGGLLALLERCAGMFRVDRVPKRDGVTLLVTACSPSAARAAAEGAQVARDAAGSGSGDDGGTRWIYVRGLPPMASETSVREQFCVFGAIESLHLMVHRGRRVSFIGFARVEDACTAVRHFGRHPAEGIAVVFARRGPGGGPSAASALAVPPSAGSGATPGGGSSESGGGSVMLPVCGGGSSETPPSTTLARCSTSPDGGGTGGWPRGPAPRGQPVPPPLPATTAAASVAAAPAGSAGVEDVSIVPTRHLRVAGPVVEADPSAAEAAAWRCRGVLAVVQLAAPRATLLVDFASTAECVEGVRAMRGIVAGGRRGIELGFRRLPAAAAEEGMSAAVT